MGANARYGGLKNQIIQYISKKFTKLLKENSALINLGFNIFNEKIVVKPSEEKYPVSILEYILRIN